MDTKTVFAPDDLARWTGGRWLAEPSSAITGFSIDTRTLQPGDLFLAIRGDQVDGHIHALPALSGGASAVMVDQSDCLHGLSVPALLVTDVRAALMEIARGYRAVLSCRIIAVTGSVGKTTVKELIADMLQHVGLTTRTKGNWNNDLGMPLSLLAARPDTMFGVFEVGMNHPGELAPLCDVLAPHISVVTCVGPVHIEHFENVAAIAREKATVYRSLQEQGIAVINNDDAYAAMMREDAAGHSIISVSAHAPADFVYHRNDPALGRFTITEASTGEVVDMMAALPGEYFVMDATLAAAVARSLHVAWPVIQNAIRHYHPLSMRWNRQEWMGLTIINDAYNANPVSMRAAVDAFLEEFTRGQRWLVVGGMLELGADEKQIHHELGRFIAQRGSMHVVAVGERGGWIVDGATEAGLPTSFLHHLADAQTAAQFLFSSIHEGDSLLFKASRGEKIDQALAALKKMRPPADP